MVPAHYRAHLPRQTMWVSEAARAQRPLDQTRRQNTMRSPPRHLPLERRCSLSDVVQPRPQRYNPTRHVLLTTEP
jgi:hypothetical protein